MKDYQFLEADRKCQNRLMCLFNGPIGLESCPEALLSFCGFIALEISFFVGSMGDFVFTISLF